jgi:hypothetical protein
MPVQTSVSTNFGLGYAGMRADNGPCDTLSCYNRNGTAIPFGLALVKGTGDRDVKLPVGGSVAADFMGLAEFTHAYKNYDLASPLGIPIGGMVDVARKGRYLVQVDGTVVAGGPVFMRIAAGTGTQLGAFRGDADTASCVALTGLKFLSAATAGNLAIVEINIP